MKIKFSIGILVLLVLVILVTGDGCGKYQTGGKGTIITKTNSISGEVIPAEAGIRVVAIQNLSLVAETVTNADGSYTIENLREGRYGLLFIKEGDTSIYNDIINKYWELDGINESIIADSGISYNINFEIEMPDYISDRIVVIFKQNVSQEEVESIVNYYDSTIVKRGISTYRINIPDNKTVPEMIALFELNAKVEEAGPELRTRAS